MKSQGVAFFLIFLFNDNLHQDSTIVKFSLKIHAHGNANYSWMISTTASLLIARDIGIFLNSTHVAGHVIGTSKRRRT